MHGAFLHCDGAIDIITYDVWHDGRVLRASVRSFVNDTWPCELGCLLREAGDKI
jgi:hypothetical protein